jgi:serine/threonine protein kinase
MSHPISTVIDLFGLDNIAVAERKAKLCEAADYLKKRQDIILADANASLKISRSLLTDYKFKQSLIYDKKDDIWYALASKAKKDYDRGSFGFVKEVKAFKVVGDMLEEVKDPKYGVVKIFNHTSKGRISTDYVSEAEAKNSLKNWNKLHPDTGRLICHDMHEDASDSSHAKDKKYLFMPKLGYRTLENYSDPKQSMDPLLISSLSEKEKFDIAFSLARGLENIHSIGLVHRDIKPANTVLDGSAVKYIDADLMAEKGKLIFRAGTLAYGSPELEIIVH